MIQSKYSGTRNSPPLLKNFLLAGILFISGCSPEKEKPSLSSIVREMDSLKTGYSNRLFQVDLTMKEVIASNYFSEQQQKTVYENLKGVRADCSRYLELQSICPEVTTSLKYPTNNFPWFELLEKNVNGIDASTPEIQKYFERKYSGFKAEGIYSHKEKEATEAAFDAAINIITTISE